MAVGRDDRSLQVIARVLLDRSADVDATNGNLEAEGDGVVLGRLPFPPFGAEDVRPLGVFEGHAGPADPDAGAVLTIDTTQAAPEELHGWISPLVVSCPVHAVQVVLEGTLLVLLVDGVLRRR
jgi:hypothetical protein